MPIEESEKRPGPRAGMNPSPRGPRTCPACGISLDKARLSAAGSIYGCSRCGKWFPDAAAPSARIDLPSPVQGWKGLTKTSIVLGMESTGLPEAVDQLVPKALHGCGEVVLRSAEIARAVREGIRLSSLELHDGLALIHHRTDCISERRMALGVSSEGIITGSPAQERVHVVFLSLMPVNRPGFNLPLWSRKKLCNQRTIYQLRKAQDVEAVLRILQGP